MCVFSIPSILWNKYARHIYCLHLGEIDGNAGEQNIYHFCLWLIVVLGMAALQREGGGGGDEEGGGRGSMRRKERERGNVPYSRQQNRNGNPEIPKMSPVPGGWWTRKWRPWLWVAGSLVQVTSWPLQPRRPGGNINTPNWFLFGLYQYIRLIEILDWSINDGLSNWTASGYIQHSNNKNNDF